MSMLGLLAAFGGGALGAALGALPAFIMTGFVALVGTGIALGGGVDFLVGNLAFGSFFGPHVAFAGGVAAAAFAANKKGHALGGADITVGLNGTGDASVILVGGVFGVIGFLINYVYAGVLGFGTDTVAMTVATSGIIVRFLFGKTGLIGKYEGEAPRAFIGMGNELIFNIVMGLVVGVLVTGVGAVLMQEAGVTEAGMGSYPAMCFAISAITLLFAQFGTAVPTTHHISLPAANAFVLSGGNILVGVVVAVICSLLGDFFTKTVNSHCDSHIDPPACTIFLVTFVIMAIF